MATSLGLPREILVAILAQLPFGKDWLSIRCVCKEWLHLSKQAFDPRLYKDKALRFACRKGLTNLLQELLADTRIQPCFNNGDRWADNLLIIATMYENIDSLRYLLRDERTSVMEDVISALYFAIMQGKLEAVKVLLEDRRILPVDIQTAQKLATKYGFHEIVQEIKTHLL